MQYWEIFRRLEKKYWRNCYLWNYNHSRNRIIWVVLEYWGLVVTCNLQYTSPPVTIYYEPSMDNNIKKKSHDNLSVSSLLIFIHYRWWYTHILFFLGNNDWIHEVSRSVTQMCLLFVRLLLNGHVLYKMAHNVPLVMNRTSESRDIGEEVIKFEGSVIQGHLRVTCIYLGNPHLETFSTERVNLSIFFHRAAPPRLYFALTKSYHHIARIYLNECAWHALYD